MSEWRMQHGCVETRKGSRSERRLPDESRVEVVHEVAVKLRRGR